jgi:glutathione synthase
MSKKNFKIAFVADPIAGFDPYAETTSFIAIDAYKRGCSCYFLDLNDLYLKNYDAFGRVKKVKIQLKNKRFVYEIISEEHMNLAKMDAIFLRKDPPVDASFIDHLSIMEFVSQRTLVLNDPTSIKFATEKIYPLHFKKFLPPTMISKDRTLVLDFIGKQKTAILKPLNLSGGREIIKVDSNNPSSGSLVDILTHNGSRYIMAQKFIPEAMKGDKRILLLDGEVLGSFLRVPPKTDFRGNLHSGAKLKAAKLTVTDQKIIATIRDDLIKRKLHFVGIDIIGNYLTEINVTSPMGIGEINQLTKTKVEKKVVDWVFKALSK